MRKTRIEADDFKDMLQWLRDNRVPYRYSFTLHTESVQSKMGSYFTSGTTIGQEGAMFIGDVKRYVINNKIHLKVKNDITSKQFDRVKYYRYQDLKRSLEANNGILKKDIWELDLTKAYWNIAHRLAIINEEIYDSGLLFDGADKIVRMAALGSLAKKEEVYYNDGTGKEDIYLGEFPPKHKRKTEFLWFKICREAGRIMNKCARAAGEGFLFFWVDGIYVHGDEAVGQVQDVMAALDCEFHVLKIKKIEAIKETKQIKVYDKKHIDKKTGKMQPRIFPLN